MRGWHLVLVLFSSLVDNQYLQKSKVLYTFTPNKFHAYLLTLLNHSGSLMTLKHISCVYVKSVDSIGQTFSAK